MVGEVEAIGFRRRFSSSYDRDSESVLDYALARYYDSRTGTFCSADPLAGSPSDPQSWNRYPYGRNDPIDITDPSGKSWWSDLIGGALDVLAFFVPPTVGLDLAYNFTNSAAEGNTIGVLGAVVGGAFAAGAQNAADAKAAAVADAHPASQVLQHRAVFPSPDNMSEADAFASDRIAKNGLGFLKVGLVMGAIDTGKAVNAAQNTLSKNCDSEFKKTIPHYTNAGFFSSLASTAFQQYPPGTPNIPSDDFGADADTLMNVPGRPIRLLPNFYGLSAPYGLSVLVHEGIHHFTGWGHEQIFKQFYNAGLRHTNPGSGDITDWIKNGCPPAK